MINIGPYSRFQFTDPILLDLAGGSKAETFGVWRAPSFITVRPAASDIGTFSVSAGYEGRPDKIAKLIYGTSKLDWVIIAFNAALDVLNWPIAGAIIEYPAPRPVFAELS